jgi:superfamily II DNA or RNA helicase
MSVGERAVGRLQFADLAPKAVVVGLVSADEPVTLVAVEAYGSAVANVTYRRASGTVGERLVLQSELPSLRLAAAGRPFTFDADPELFKLAAEARRLSLAAHFDPLLAVTSSTIEPLPHQITAVYGELLPRRPLRFLLADDPGAGKTVMAGLYIKELMLRGDLARCLIVAPGSLVEQWQDELSEKFGLSFDILSREAARLSITGNPFEGRDLVIARLDVLSRSDELQNQLAKTDWDLVVVDEAHRMSAHYFGGELKTTRRYELGRRLGQVARHLLLMTATPHSGKEEDFQLFLALLDGDRFEGRFRDGVHSADHTDLMRRMVKEKLLRFDGTKLFPERRASTVPYPLSELEQLLYDEVTLYVREEMNRAQRLSEQGQGRRGNTVGFALTVLQRRLASSPAAIHGSLERRALRLRRRVAEARELTRHGGGALSARERLGRILGLQVPPDIDPEDVEDLAGDELEELETAVVDAATAASTLTELEYELETVTRLTELARQVRLSGRDRKWQELSGLMQSPAMHDQHGDRRKLIIFTEHRDTLDYLVERLQALLGRADAITSIHGGTPREERRKRQDLFTQDKDCVVLVATDAAGEGVNLQRAHLLVNYDLPWNPNRIEQRFGRVHRIGQREVCHMWNLVAEGTREGQVYLRLLDKIEQQRRAYGGQIFDVLGQAFEGQPLSDLLVRAIRYGEDPRVRAELDLVIDAAVGEGLGALIEREALDSQVLALSEIERIRLELEEAQARRLQPHYILSFFLAAFTHLGGRLREVEPGRWELTSVPMALRERDRLLGGRAPLLRRYERVCFDKDLVRAPGKPLAELVTPGHPLLDVSIDLVLERHRSLLRRGAVLIADEPATVPRLLVFLEHEVSDGRAAADGPRVVSKRFAFVELEQDGTARAAGPAPYLDYRPPTREELSKLQPLVAGDWPGAQAESAALRWAVAEAVPEHLAEVRRSTVERVDRIRDAVRRRLRAEIDHWDHRALVLQEQVAAGKQPRMQPLRARERADALAARLQRRLAELDRESELAAKPPVVVGAALVVPEGVLATLGTTPPQHARDTEEVDRRAVAGVLAAERRLHRQPTEMPHNNRGYDVQSHTLDGHLLFLEVKGRIEGAYDVTVTRNEVLHIKNAGDRGVLALVRVSASGAAHDEVRYQYRPFDQTDVTDLTVTKVVLDWEQRWAAASTPA